MKRSNSIRPLSVVLGFSVYLVCGSLLFGDSIDYSSYLEGVSDLIIGCDHYRAHGHSPTNECRWLNDESAHSFSFQYLLDQKIRNGRKCLQKVLKFVAVHFEAEPNNNLTQKEATQIAIDSERFRIRFSVWVKLLLRNPESIRIWFFKASNQRLLGLTCAILTLESKASMHTSINGAEALVNLLFRIRDWQTGNLLPLRGGSNSPFRARSTLVDHSWFRFVD